ncbi:MAG TPA: flagellar basal body P-ring protein FlgI [Isosphaeraceae bacterium]|jgi:hypothetical protein|nr:flagellar basal body P-ring protein FlgI [Isosphaeraceae bacterium]
MRRQQSGRVPALAVLAAFLAAPMAFGAGGPSKVEETVSDLAFVATSQEVPVEGVGLVMNLDGTGSDPAPDIHRKKLVDEMRKARVDRPDLWLANGQTSLVLVRTKIPPGIGPADGLDVEVVLPPGSKTTSLAGGWLIQARLTEVGIDKQGNEREGRYLAWAMGPVMTGTKDKPDDLKSGRILGGGHVKKEIPYLLLIKPQHQSGRTAALLEAIVRKRFNQHQGHERVGMATAKSDKHLELRVPRVYHQNQSRYFQVVRLLPVAETPDLDAERRKRWGKELLDPKTAGVAALKLEGLGTETIPELKAALTSPDAQVRFFAAEALAYLGDESCVPELARTAVEREEFRAYALSALATVDEPVATIQLRKLMDQPDPKVRYGAFNALRRQDPTDGFLGRVRLAEDEPEPQADNPMAMPLPPVRSRNRAPDPFALYIVDSDGPPMVHVSRARRPEIVVFGRGQRLATPLVLGGSGTFLINADLGDEQLQLSRIGTGGAGRGDRKVAVPPDLGEVIRQLARLDATYPEIVALLTQAQRQANLPGPLIVDATPLPDPKYTEAQLAGKDAGKKDDAVQRAKADAPQGRRGLIGRLRGRLGR